MIQRHRKIIAWTWAGSIGLLTTLGGAEQEPYREPMDQQQVLTEAEAVAYGLVHNPGLRARRSFIGVGEGEVINEAILRDAIISGAVEREREREREVGEDDETSIARSRRFAASQGFEIAAQRPFEILAARAELDALRLEVAEAEIDLVREIKSVLAEFLAATDLIAEIHNVIYKAKPLMWEATAGKPNERLRVSMGFLFFQQSFPENALERMEAENELNHLLGLPPDTRLFISASLEPQPIPLSYDELKESIFARNVELRVTLAELRAARFELELAMRDRAPEVEVEYANRRVRGESGKVVRSSETGIGAAWNVFRQFVEQNRGEVYGAKSAVETAQDEVQATRWEVEAELFELYQVLNLTRSRIMTFEHGFLAQLEMLLLEFDVEDYEEGKIDIDTWERDFNRYHSRGEQLISIKAKYKQTLAALEFLAGGSFASPIQVAMETTEPEGNPAGYPEGLVLKLSRGLGTIALSPIEIPAAWYGYTLDRGVWGALFGPYEGAVTSVTRAAGGALDVITAPIPWPLESMKPVSLPIWGENPWTGSWSLRYVHPAYNQDYLPLHEQVYLSEGGR